MGLEVLAAAAVAYVLRKATRVGRRVDQDVDEALDAGLDRLHEAVIARLSGDAGLLRLEEQAKTGEVAERTRRRVEDAIADAAEDDPEFAVQLQALVEMLAAQETAAGMSPPAEVKNLIKGGTQNAPVIMGGTISGITIYGSGSPAHQAPSQRVVGAKDRRNESVDAAYRRFMACLPPTSFATVQWVPAKKRSLGDRMFGYADVMKPAEPAYKYDKVVQPVLEEIRKLIAARSMDGLSAYLASCQLQEQGPSVEGWSQTELYSAESVDSYLHALRQCLSTYFGEHEGIA